MPDTKDADKTSVTTMKDAFMGQITVSKRVKICNGKDGIAVIGPTQVLPRCEQCICLEV